LGQSLRLSIHNIVNYNTISHAIHPRKILLASTATVFDPPSGYRPPMPQITLHLVFLCCFGTIPRLLDHQSYLWPTPMSLKFTLNLFFSPHLADSPSHSMMLVIIASSTEPLCSLLRGDYHRWNYSLPLPTPSLDN
jgi:hypothetical protein